MRTPGPLPSGQTRLFQLLKSPACRASPVHAACFTHRVTRGFSTGGDSALQVTLGDVWRQCFGCHPGKGAATSIL